MSHLAYPFPNRNPPPPVPFKTPAEKFSALAASILSPADFEEPPLPVFERLGNVYIPDKLNPHKSALASAFNELQQVRISITEEQKRDEPYPERFYDSLITTSSGKCSNKTDKLFQNSTPPATSISTYAIAQHGAIYCTAISLGLARSISRTHMTEWPSYRPSSPRQKSVHMQCQFFENTASACLRARIQQCFYVHRYRP